MLPPSPTPPFDAGDVLDTGTEYVRAARVDGVGVIELYQPSRRNALHREMYDAVPELITRFEADAAIGVIVVTGAGEGFCAGGDVQAGVAALSSGPILSPPSNLARDARLVVRLHESPLLSIAALPGAAVGAGLSIALACDFRIAARSARMIGGWARLGFSGDFGGAWFLTRLVGPAKALELLVDNTALGAEQAESMGLINRVVDDAQLRPAALAWAQALAEGSKPAHSFMKGNIRDALHLSLAEFIPIESERQRRSGQTDEHRAAVRRWLADARAKRAATVAESTG